RSLGRHRDRHDRNTAPLRRPPGLLAVAGRIDMPEDKPLVLILIGSKSDWDTMRHAAETLKEFGVPCESRVASAHRSPELAVRLASGAEQRGIEVVIAAAGGAAHLAGVV